MKNALLINTLFNDDILKISINGRSVINTILEKALKLFKKSDIYILSHIDSHYIKNELNNFHVIEVDKRVAADVLPLIYKKIKDYDTMVYFFADEPLVDVEITKRLITLHNEEIADYSYGEGFVKGIAPEILSVELLPKLALLDRDKDTEITDKKALFNLLSKEINSFDIETLFADKDLRLMRFELATSEKRYRLIVERLVSIAGSFDIPYGSICDIIEKRPEIVRTIPSYIEIELTNKLHYPLIYYPISAITRERGVMEYKDYRAILKSILNFTDRIHISISYLGEPLLHKDIRRIIEDTVKEKNVSLIVETDGIDFTPDFSNFITDLDADNLTIIFQVDAVNDDTYRKIHGTEIKYVERNIRYLLSKVKRNVYVQMVRMDMNEDEMLDFYRMWEKEGAGVIIQKYNDFLGNLPKLSSVDLRPLEKICCYHLMRDMVVFFDGDVPRCKQDINANYLLGNVLSESMENVWSRGEPHFKSYCIEKYDEDCKRCDEYYVFNF